MDLDAQIEQTILPALYLFIREVAGLSPRCKLAASLKDQIASTIAPAKS